MPEAKIFACRFSGPFWAFIERASRAGVARRHGLVGDNWRPAAVSRRKTVRGKSPAWPFPTCATPENAEGVRGCRSPHPSGGRLLPQSAKRPFTPLRRSSSRAPIFAQARQRYHRANRSINALRRSAVIDRRRFPGGRPVPKAGRVEAVRLQEPIEGAPRHLGLLGGS